VETAIQATSWSTVHHCTLVFPAPAWVRFGAAGGWVVDSPAGSMKQDVLAPGTSPDKAGVNLPYHAVLAHKPHDCDSKGTVPPGCSK